MFLPLRTFKLFEITNIFHAFARNSDEVHELLLQHVFFLYLLTNDKVERECRNRSHSFVIDASCARRPVTKSVSTSFLFHRNNICFEDASYTIKRQITSATALSNRSRYQTWSKLHFCSPPALFTFVQMPSSKSSDSSDVQLAEIITPIVTNRKCK